MPRRRGCGLQAQDHPEHSRIELPLADQIWPFSAASLASCFLVSFSAAEARAASFRPISLGSRLLVLFDQGGI